MEAANPRSKPVTASVTTSSSTRPQGGTTRPTTINTSRPTTASQEGGGKGRKSGKGKGKAKAKVTTETERSTPALGQLGLESVQNLVDQRLDSKLGPIQAALDALLSARTGTGEVPRPPGDGMNPEALVVHAPEDDSLFGSPPRTRRWSERPGTEDQQLPLAPSFDWDVTSEQGSDESGALSDFGEERPPADWISLLASVRSHLGVKAPEKATDVRESFLERSFEHLGSKHTAGAPELPMEGLVAAAWKDVSKGLPQIKSYKNKQRSMYRWDEKDFEAFGKVPRLDPAASAFSRASGGRKSDQRELTCDKLLVRVDNSLRHLMRTVSHASIFLSSLTALTSGEGPRGLGVEDDLVKSLLGAIASALVDATDLTARASASCVVGRRKSFLDTIPGLDPLTRDELLKLEPQGPWLFGNKFQDITHRTSEQFRDAKESARVFSQGQRGGFKRPFPRPSVPRFAPQSFKRPRFEGPKGPSSKPSSTSTFSQRRPSWSGSRGSFRGSRFKRF